MLNDLSALDAFLDQIFSSAEKNGYRISIKTRMGVHSTKEFPPILEIYNRYPLTKLIIHARDRDGQYKSIPDLTGFDEACRNCRCPATYNGNLFSPGHMQQILTAAPEVKSVMVGRGAAANPALVRTLTGGETLRCEELQHFHDMLFDAYRVNGLSTAFTVERMKQLWYYMHWMFPEAKKEYKALLKAKSDVDYLAAVNMLFRSGKFDSGSCFEGRYCTSPAE